MSLVIFRAAKKHNPLCLTNTQRQQNLVGKQM